MPAVPKTGTIIRAAARPRKEKPSREMALATFTWTWRIPTYCLKRTAWSFTRLEPGL